MWRRAGRTLATAIYTLAMIAIYLIAGAIAVTAAFAARRRQRTGWQLPPNSSANAESQAAGEPSSRDDVREGA
jgi:hypothetical protein